MTTVCVESGICGFSTDIRASKIERRSIEISIESDCKQVTALGKKIRNLEIKDIINGPINKNPVYEHAGECNIHSSCPVPCGVLKAAEVELGLALKKDVRIEFGNGVVAGYSGSL